MKTKVFALLNLGEYILICALFALCIATWSVAAADWLCVDTVQASLQPSLSAALSVLLQL